MKTLKKYPVKYKGQEYEVRWEGFEYGVDYVTVEIYKVTKYLFGIKTYKYIYGLHEDTLITCINSEGIAYDNENIYIEEVKMLFKRAEKKLKRDAEQNSIQHNKENALKKWNGVIE